MNVPGRAAGGLIIRDGSILLGRRSANKTYANCWDVPGGHLEGNETPDAALCRELNEEIGITATRFEFHSIQEDSRHELHLFVVLEWRGTPALLNDEHSVLVWHKLTDAHRLTELADPRMAEVLSDLAKRFATLPAQF